jgi:Transcription factor WhiB
VGIPRRRPREADRSEGSHIAELIPPAPAWWRDALCLGTGIDRWWRDGNGGLPIWLKKQRKVCAVCPVRQECFDDAIIEPLHMREVGPMRAGLIGSADWRPVYRTLKRND